MRSQKESDDLLKQLSRLPDVKMKPVQKQEILTNILNEESKWSKRKKTSRSFKLATNLLVFCSVMLLMGYIGLNYFHLPGQIAVPDFPDTNADAVRTSQPPQEETTPSTDEQRALTLELMQLAKKGQVPDCDFAAETALIDQIKAVWGEPDKEEGIAHGIYATYEKRGFVFGFNKGEQVIDVRSYSPNLQKLAYSTVISILGKPMEVRKLNNQDILVYQATDKYQLKLIFPEPTADRPNPTLDHISVYYPRGAVNLMSQ